MKSAAKVDGSSSIAGKKMGDSIVTTLEAPFPVVNEFGFHG